MHNQHPIQCKRLLFAVIVLLLLISGCFDNPASFTTTGSQYENFLFVWDEYEANYPEFTMKGLDWKETFYRYYSLAQQVETTEELAYQVLQPMISEMMDAHSYILKPDGTYILPYPLEYLKNFEESVLMENYLLPAGFTGSYDRVGYCDTDVLPYLSISAWNLAPDFASIGEYLERSAERPAIILDMRNNPGGSNFWVPRVVGFFTSTRVRVGYKRSRTGPEYDDVFHELQFVEPNASVFYSGTVYLLIGGYSVSATEIFALYMSNLDNVVLIGDTTPGLGCGYDTIYFADGWGIPKFYFSTRGLDYEPIEWYGITPDICIEATEADFAQGIDPVLEYAIDLVNSQQ